MQFSKEEYAKQRIHNGSLVQIENPPDAEQLSS